MTAGALLLLIPILGSARLVLPDAAGAPVPGLTVGVTHTERFPNRHHPAEANDRAYAVLEAVAPIQNQHLMGWGALNPEPRPGEYDFTSLDRRIDMITATGAEPAITLCCAPDWMKGGKPGTTDWSRIEVAPERQHFDDFARLAQVAAKRYPQVDRFFVWNEFKGFHDPVTNAWDSAAYTDLYNRVYEAVKEVRPDALVGGPYVIMQSWASQSAGGFPSDLRGPWGVLDRRPLEAIDYWLEHAVGADFIAIDGGTRTRDRGLITTDFEANAKLSVATEWVRSRTDLPIWWVEFNAECSNESAPPGDPRRAAVMLDALVKVAQSGASAALLWGAEATSHRKTAALFSHTSARDGGEALPLVDLLRMVGTQLREDPQQVETTWSPAESRWSLTTPQWSIVWTPDTGIEATELR